MHGQGFLFIPMLLKIPLNMLCLLLAAEQCSFFAQGICIQQRYRNGDRNESLCTVFDLMSLEKPQHLLCKLLWKNSAFTHTALTGILLSSIFLTLRKEFLLWKFAGSTKLRGVANTQRAVQPFRTFSQWVGEDGQRGTF